MRAAPLLALALIACGGTVPDEYKEEEARCVANLPPEAPVIATPSSGSQYLLLDEIAISASPFRDTDGDPMGAAEVEIWATAPSGTLGARVWSASFDSMPDQVTVDDGTFDLGLDGLQPETSYAAIVRYQDARAPLGSLGCAAWSPWSEPSHFVTDNGSRVFFDDRQIQDIFLEVPAESWGPLDAQARPPGCVPFERQYYPGTVTVGGQRYEGVGVKTKGGCGSSRHLSGKASWKVNLEWDDPAVPGCPAGRRHGGQRTFTLNNGVQDRTGSHERVAYDFYRAMGVGASRMAHVRVHVNGTYWGLYQMLETVERPMLKRWYGAGGMLYEGTYWCDVISSNLPVGDVDNKCLTREFRPTACDGALEPGDDPETYDALRAFVARLDAVPPGQFLPAAREFLDVDEFLSMWAASSVLGHWDSYELNIVNNYRMYHDPRSGLWHFLPSGLDQTMASDVNPFGPSGRVARMCLENAECKGLFAARLREAAEMFESMDYVGRAQQIQEHIRPHVMADPRKEYDMSTWEGAHASWRQWMTNRPAQIRQKLAAAGY